MGSAMDVLLLLKDTKGESNNESVTPQGPAEWSPPTPTGIWRVFVPHPLGGNMRMVCSLW